MQEQQMANQAISMLVNIYLGVFDAFPNFFDMIQEHKRSAYFEDIVSRDIDFNNNMTYITADNRATSEVRLKLQAKGIPYIEVDSSVFEGSIKTNGKTLYILREADYERAVDLTKEIEKEHEEKLKEQLQQESELERTREDEIAQAREYYEKKEEEPDSETQPKPDEDIEESEEEPSDEDDSKKKDKKDKKKKPANRHKADRSHSQKEPYQAPPPDSITTNADAGSRSQYDSDLQEQQRREAEWAEKERQETERRERESQEKAQAEREQRDKDLRSEADQRRREEHRREQDNRQRMQDSERAESLNRESQEQNRRESEQKQRDEEQRRRDDSQRREEKKSVDYKEQERKAAERSSNTEKDISRDGNRYKSMDFHNQSFESDGSGYEARREAEEKNKIIETRKPDAENKPQAGADKGRAPEKHDSRDDSRSSYRPEESSHSPSYDEEKRRQEESRQNDSTYKKPEPRAEESQRQGGWSSAEATARTIQQEKREPAAEPRTDRSASSRPETRRTEESRTVQPETVRHTEEINHKESDVTPNGASVLGNGANVDPAKSETQKNTTRFSGAPGEPRLSEDKKPEHKAETGGYSNASASDIGKVASKSGNVKISVGRISEGEVVKNMFEAGSKPEGAAISPGNTSVLSSFSKQLLNKEFPDNAEISFSERGGKYQCVVRMDITSEVMKNRRMHQLSGIANSKKIHDLIHSTKSLVVGSVINRQSDAGMAAQEMIDVASPTGRLLMRKFLHHGALQLAKETQISYGTFVAAYSAMKGIDMAEARRQVTAFTLSGAFGTTSGAPQVSIMEMNKILQANGYKNFNQMIRGLSESQFRQFIQNAMISDGLKKAMLGYTKEQLNDPAVISKLMKKFTSPHDQAFLGNLNAADMENKFKKGSISGVIQRYLLQIFKRMARDSDAGKAWFDIYNSAKYMYSAYSAMMRFVMKSVGKFGVTTPSRLAGIIADPLDGATQAARKAGQKAFGFASKKFTETKAGQVVASRFGRSARAALRKRAVNAVTSRVMRTRVLGGSIRGIKALTGALKSTIMNTRLVTNLMQLGGHLSKIAAQIAAKAGAALGWIAIIALIIIILLEIIQTQIKEDEENSDGMSNYTFVQDTEILQEIITELTAKNTQFIAEINDAKNHRGRYASTAGVTANETAGFYESYTVLFRDFNGNILEPSHVDLNNTEAIISMASKFMPYPFTKLSENASDEQKKEYEDLKQHFKDYCYFLWAATHQISIEEYHPGDANYAEYDISGLETTLDTGVCEKDGTKIWLQDDFTPNYAKSDGVNYLCEDDGNGYGCSEYPITEYGQALCSHPKDSNDKTSGWQMTGNSRVAINCHKEHHHDCDHDDGDCNTDPCSVDAVYDPAHKHIEWEWEYKCGGHMASVVYVTIGDLSRMPSFPAAEDIDYGSVTNYPDEDTASADGESTNTSSSGTNTSGEQGTGTGGSDSGSSSTTNDESVTGASAQTTPGGITASQRIALFNKVYPNNKKVTGKYVSDEELRVIWNYIYGTSFRKETNLTAEDEKILLKDVMTMTSISTHLTVPGAYGDSLSKYQKNYIYNRVWGTRDDMSSNVLNEEMRLTWNKVYLPIYRKDVGESLTNEELKTLYNDIIHAVPDMLVTGTYFFTGTGTPGLPLTL